MARVVQGNITKYWKHNYSLNANTVGSLQIDGTKLSGFSTSNYAKTIPEDFAYYASSANNWEVQFKVYHVQNNNYHVLYANGLGHGTLFGIGATGYLDIYVTNGSASGYYVEMHTSSTLQTNTLYWLKFMFTGTQYLIKVSTDGVNFSTWGTANTADKVPYRSGAMWRIGVSAQSGYESPFNAGYIDLAESYIKINDNYWWQGLKDVPISATKDDYDFITVEKGSKIIKREYKEYWKYGEEWQQPDGSEWVDAANNNTWDTSRYNTGASDSKYLSDGIRFPAAGRGAGWTSSIEAGLRHWVGCYTEPIIVSSFAFKSAGAESNCPPAFDFQGSNDGVTWDTLGSYTRDQRTYDQVISHEVPEHSEAYSYHRIFITVPNDHSFWFITRITITARKASTPATPEDYDFTTEEKKYYVL